MKVGDLVRKRGNIWAHMEPWDSHGLLSVGIIIGPAKSSDFTVLWTGRYRTYELVKNLEVVQERRLEAISNKVA